jgi:hypothetical protein
MHLSSQTKCLFLVAAVLLLIYILNNCSNNNPIHNDGKLPYEAYSVTSKEGNKVTNDHIDSESDDETSYASNSTDNSSQLASVSSMPDQFEKKVSSKNRATGDFKRSDYSSGERGASDAKTLDDFFNDGNDLANEANSNDNFKGQDLNNGKLAAYKGAGKKTELADEDLFKVDDYLPQDKNKDWFDVMPEPISVKNRHLINVSRPVGVNTIGTTLKNASYDIRGTPACPKFVVSPWLQSSYEPDTNLKGLC